MPHHDGLPLLPCRHTTGALPTSLGEATSLRLINLSKNKLTGEGLALFPTAPPRLPRISHCWVPSGSFPNSMSALLDLIDLQLPNNELAGEWKRG